MATEKPRVQINRDDFLKTFTVLYNQQNKALETIPLLMD